jgi:hypothetical protein
VPLETTAQACANPAVNDTTDVKLPTKSGVERMAVVPSPSCPYEFKPQHFTLPSDIEAHENWLPHTTVATPLDKPKTATGVCLFVVVPSPTCLFEF